MLEQVLRAGDESSEFYLLQRCERCPAKSLPEVWRVLDRTNLDPTSSISRIPDELTTFQSAAR